MVRFVVQRVVAAPREGAFSVPQPQPLPHGLGEPVAGPADLQRRPVPRVHQDPVERVSAVGHEVSGHRGRDRPVPVQHRRFVGGAEQRKHRHGHQDLGPRGRDPAWAVFCRVHAGTPVRTAVRGAVRIVVGVESLASASGVSAAQERGGEDVGAELGEGAVLVRALQAAGDGGGPVPDRSRLVRGQVRREPGHPVLVRGVLDAAVQDTFGVALLDAFGVMAFAPRTGLVPEPGGRHLPGGAPPHYIEGVRVQEVGLQRRRTGPVQGGGFVRHDPGVLPGNGPGPQGGQGQRQSGGESVRNGQERTRRAVTDSQGTPNLGRDCHLLGLDRSVRRGRRLRGRNKFRCSQSLQAGHLCVRSLSPGQNIQAILGHFLQRISPRRGRTGTRLVHHAGQHSHGSLDVGICLRHHRIPHATIMTRGSDIQAGRPLMPRSSVRAAPGFLRPGCQDGHAGDLRLPARYWFFRSRWTRGLTSVASRVRDSRKCSWGRPPMSICRKWRM